MKPTIRVEFAGGILEQKIDAQNVAKKWRKNTEYISMFV